MNTYEILKNITNTQGTNAKKDLLTLHKDNTELLSVLKFVFDPLIVSGISDKKLSKQLPNIENKYSLTELLDYIKVHNTGRDEDIQIIQSFISSNSEYKDIITKIVCQNFHDLGIATKAINKVIPNLIYEFEVQLAERYFDMPEFVEGKDFTITLKYDGFRCVAIKEKGNVKIFARSGKEMTGLVDIISTLKSWKEDNFVLDGEILIQNRKQYPSKQQYKLTSNIVSSKNTEKHGLCLNAFDYLTLDEWKNHKCITPYSERRKKLNTFISNDFIIIVPTLYTGNDTNKINELHNKAKLENEEGIMVNINTSIYEFKRTKNLLKCKTFNECDAYIDGVSEGSKGSKYENKLGNFICHFTDKDNTIVKFECGGGFTDEDRETFWKNKDSLIGRVCEVKYFEITQDKDGNKSIRFPVFKTLKDIGTKPNN